MTESRTSDDGENVLTVTFENSRTTEGIDVGSFLRDWPDSDIEAVLDDRGAVTAYRVRTHFESADALTDTLFRLRDRMAELGAEVEWDE